MFGRLLSAPIWLRVTTGVVIGVLLLLLILRLFAMTPMARGMVESRLEAMTVRGQSVSIDGLEGDVLGRLTAERLRISDEQGVWIDGSNMQLQWSPMPALFGHLKIRQVAFTDLDLARRPDLAPAAPQSGGSSGFFRRYEVEDLDVESLVIADGVAGPRQEYTLDARLDTTRTQGDVSLNLVPIEGRGDDIRAELDWGGDVPLRGRVSLSGAPSGLIATLLQVPDGQGVSANLDTSGTWASWQLTANGAVGGVTVLELEGDMRDGVRAFEGRLSLAPLGRLRGLNQRLGDQIAFKAEHAADNRVSGEVVADTLKLQLAGTVAATSGGSRIEDFTLDVSDLDAEALTGAPELALEVFSAAGVLELTSEARVFEGDLSTPRLRLDGYDVTEASSTGRYEWRGQDLVIDTNVALRSLSGLPDALEGVLDGPLELSANATLKLDRRAAEIKAFTLETQNAQVQATGAAAMAGPIDLTGALRLQDRRPISDLDATWSLRGPALSDTELTVSGAAELEALPTGLDDRAQIDLTLKREGGDLVLETSVLQTDQLRVTAAGVLQQGNLDLDGRLTAPSLLLDGVRADALNARFDITGPVAAPRVDLNLTSEQLALFGQSIGSPALTGQVSIDDGFAFDLEANAVYLDADFSTALQGGFRNGLVQIRDMSAAWDALAATGQGQFDIANPRRSALVLNMDGAAPLVGEVSGAVRFSEEVLSADVSVGAFALGPMSVAQGQAQVSGTWPRFQGQIDYTGQTRLLNEALPVSGQHGLNVDLAERFVSIEGGSQIAGQGITVSSPITWEFGPEPQIIGSLAAFEGGVSFGIHPDGARPSQVSLNEISMTAVGPLLLRPSLRGVLNGQVELSLLDGELRGMGQGKVAGLARGGPDAPIADLGFDAVIEANQLTAQIRASDADERLDLVAALSASLTHSESLFSIRPIEGAPIPASLTGGGPIAPLWALVAPPDLRVEGELVVDINNGTGEAFRFDGPLSFRDGVFEDGLTGLHLNALAIDADLDPSGIAVRTASASGIRGGRLEASGVYDFDGDGSVSLQLDRLNALNRADIDATVSGLANIERRSRRTHVEGDLILNEARVNLSSLPGAGYTTMDVLFTNGQGEMEDSAPVREAISLDLGVTASRRIFVTGPALETEWGINARVTGSPGRPNIIGRATLVRGEADLLSRRFRLSEGSVRFVGAPTDSEIAISAERASGDISAWIDVSGNVLDPTISLRADPPLPDDEILARVLFGRSPGELSPLQAAQLAGAAASLAGGEAFNLMNELEASVGLDRLDFGFDDSGAAFLSTGKYIADDVYLEVQSGVTGAPGVALEWTPLENVAIDAEVDPELGPKVSVQWKRDFDDRPAEPAPD